MHFLLRTDSSHWLSLLKQLELALIWHGTAAGLTSLKLPLQLPHYQHFATKNQYAQGTQGLVFKDITSTFSSLFKLRARDCSKGSASEHNGQWSLSKGRWMNKSHQPQTDLLGFLLLPSEIEFDRYMILNWHPSNPADLFHNKWSNE